jgi:hypothetical protein
MSRIVLLSAVLAVLLAVGAVTFTVAFRLTHRRALAAQPLDPAILHGALRKLQTDGALP